MSYENFVRVKVVTPVTAVATSFAIVDAVAPQKLPPTDGGYLVLCDSPGNPSWIEVVQYTSRSGLGISGVTRGVEGTTAVAWSGNVYAFQALMAGEANLIQSTLAGKQDEIAPGTTAQFWRGDKTWVDFMTTVRAATLTGLSTATGTAITAADTVLSGLGKLQKQISDAATNLAANVRAVVLTGYVAGANSALAATDTVLGAFGKVQGQLNAKAPLASPALTGVPTVPTAATGTNTLQASSTAFVQQELAALINSAPGAMDTLNELAAAMGDDPNFAATMTTALAGKEPSIAADLVSKFYSGTKTWRDLPTDVRAVVLTGLSVATGTAVAAGDTILVGMGKLQKQCTDRLLLAGGKMTGAINEAVMASLASAATVNIGAAASNSVKITGSVTISAFDSSTEGTKRTLYFGNGLIMNHSANLFLPGSLNLSVNAGDWVEFTCMGGAAWYCSDAHMFDGQPVRTVNFAHGGTGATDAAGARANLGLVPTTSNQDITAGSLLRVGDFGMGAPVGLSGPDLNSSYPTGFYYVTGASNAPYTNGWLINQSISANYITQTFTAENTGIKYTRSKIGGTWGLWREDIVVGAYGIGAQPADIPSITNITSCTSVGFYKYAGGATGAPDANGGSLIVTSLGGNFIQQIALTVPGTTTNPSMQYRHFDGSGNPGPWVKMAHTGNMVGTVAQTSGVPTGAIIETGTNASGTYTKYADGTLICRGNFQMPAQAITSQTILYVPMPATFAGGYSLVWVPLATVGTGSQQDVGALLSNGVYQAKFTTYVNMQCYSYRYAQTFPVDCTFVAYGRWY